MLHSRLKGRDLHSPTNEIVENNTGLTIPALKVVRLVSQGVAYPEIALADPVNYVNFAITYDNILNGKTGLACAFGFMVDVDTSAWPDGTELYSDSSGNLSTIQSGGLVAQVIKQNATSGILYVVTEPSAEGSGSWGLTGNAGTDENANFLGTTDNRDIRFRTNNLFGMGLTKQGRLGLGLEMQSPAAHFHQKTHSGYANSGLRQETFALSTNTLGFQPAYSITLSNPSVVRVEFVVVGRSNDGLRRCMFKRTGLFYRQFGNVQSQGIWLSDQTIKSNPNLDVGYQLNVTDVTLTVSAGTSDITYWTGHVIVEMLTNSI